jgi:outer membrane protein assembly factor BamB
MRFTEKKEVIGMKIAKNKIAAILIALFLMLTLAVTIIAMPLVYAQESPARAWNIPTYAYISVAPNPAGVDQTVSIIAWLDKVPPTANVQYGDRWHNMKVTVTKPDGTTEILNMLDSDAAGGTWASYTPKAVGNYTFVLTFPGQTIIGENPAPYGTWNPQTIGDYYKPSTSDAAKLVVQQTPIPDYPVTPLPTSYWQRPIFAMNTEWYTLGGNWLGLGPVSFGTTGMYNAVGNFNPYTTAPNTAHIVWTKPYAFGGIIGGEFGNSQMNSNFKSTSQYEPKFQPIIINGMLYYTLFPGSIANPAGWVALDLRTGQTIWTKNTTAVLKTGQLLDFVAPNQYGATAYLWSKEHTVTPNTGNTFGMYDAMTGTWILNVVNATEITSFVEGEDGSLLGYWIDYASMTLNMWNSTKAIMQYTLAYPVYADPLTGYWTDDWSWRPPQGVEIPWGLGIEWSKPLVTTMTASNGTVVNIDQAYAESAGLFSPLTLATIADGVVIVDNAPGDVFAFHQPGYTIQEGYSASDGHLLWGPLNQTQTPWCKLSLGTISAQYLGSVGVGEGVYTIYTFETRTYTGYSIATGQKLWGPVGPNTNSWGYYAQSSIVAYGNLYTCDFGGYVNAYNVTTGALKWTYNTNSSGTATPYGIWPLLHIDVIADDKLYVMGGHTYSPPLFHGSELHCLNASTGEEIWSTFNFPTTNGASAAIADGYLVEPNAYDNQIYCFNKGPSAVTVKAPDTYQLLGKQVLVTGTVMDISPGTGEYAQTARFPNGVPAIADEDMSAWMEYVYMQQVMPTDAKGVEIVVEVLDPNSNYYQVGRTTSDATGFYSLSFTPEVSGKYTVVARFAGSESYYSSFAKTGLGVEEATAVTPEPTQAPTSLADQYLLPATGGIIAAIAVVGALMLLQLRKR